MADSKKFLLRLDPGLFDALSRWASDDMRSINAQIEYLLTDQARRAGRLPKRTTRRPPRATTTDESADSEITAVPAGARRKHTAKIPG